MASPSQDEKVMFFKGLDKLDELAVESDHEVTSNTTHNEEHIFSSVVHRGPPLSQKEAPNVPLSPTPVSHVSESRPLIAPLESMMPAIKSKRESASSKVLLTKQSKKKSGKKSLQLQPEESQLFRGLIFYFLPNNDIAPARRKRIEKAQEYGAQWARDWSDDVTHVIVDRGLVLSDVRKFVGHGRLKPDHIVVNETYPPDCISYGVLLPVGLVKFQVPGHVPVREAENQPRRKPSDTASKVIVDLQECNTDTDNAAKQQRANENQDGVLKEVIRPIAMNESGDRVSITNIGQREGDELDSIVAEVQDTAELPFDSEDDSFASTSYTDRSDSEGGRPTESRRKKRKRQRPNLVDPQHQFSCMNKNDGVSKEGNPNCKTIEKLDRMAHYYDRTGDHWRTIAYRKCIAALKRQTEHITTTDQAIRIPGIGGRLAEKIEEIALTNRLRRLESAVLNTNDQLLQVFMGIYQVGLPTASRWIAQGHKTLKDLKSNADLSVNQKIGIDHYDDFLARIPRSEVTAHADIVEKACAKAKAGIQVIIGGSYRRGAADCGDIDLILTKKDASLDNIRPIMIDSVIPQLFQEGFLQVALASSRSRDRDQGSKWHGASALPGSTVWRRIDFLFVPWDELGAALIYFTGNDIFNRSIRLLASRMQMRLNQHGLFGDVMRGEKRARVTQGKLLEGRSEKRIFKILGVPWRPPEHRIC